MASINAAYIPVMSKEGVPTSTVQVPSALGVLKAFYYAAQRGFWYHLTRICALAAPCCAFYEKRRETRRERKEALKKWAELTLGV
jgi:hypothetical protein